MKNKGFTLIELLVVIVIIGILVAIALPNFIKIKDKAKEAEVKQNLHAIQLAIERYATDMDGNYPYFLFGGEGLFNLGTINHYNPPPRSGSFAYNPQRIAVPFDMFALGGLETWSYDKTDWGNIEAYNVEAPFGDTLSFEGYMPKFPSNPFQKGRKATAFSIAGIGLSSASGMRGTWACYGGHDGFLMWDLSQGYGEVSQIIEFPDNYELVDLDLPGNFTYHPRWSDGVTNFEHMAFQQNWNDQCWLPYNGYGGPLPAPLNDFEDEINSLDVAGYDLTAVGSPRTKGQDLDTSISHYGADHYFRTGYLTLAQERNPYVGSGAIEGDFGGTVENYDERPYSDSIPDFYIIHLGSGMDKKVANPNN